jgi:MSHA biogenesis protein MshL
LRKALLNGQKLKERDMKNRNLIFLIFLIAIGCATPETGEKKAPVTASPKPLPPIKEKLEELTVSPIEEEIKEPEKLYTLSFRKADIHEILSVLCRESKLNIIVDPDVRGEVTVDLKEVTLAKALDCLLTPLRMEYRREANFIKVSPIRMQTRMLTLNYLTTKRSASGTVSGTSGTRAGTALGSFIKVETADIADLWKEIEEGLKSIASEKGRLVINKVSGSILVTDFPQNLAKIAEFLETIEGSAQRQVMIQAKIIEVTLSDQYQMGIDWSAIATSGSARGTFTQLLSPATETFQIGITNSKFSFLLDAMSKQGKLDILSSPKVSTLNSQPAVIKVAREDVYWEREFAYTAAAGGEAMGFSRPRWITVGIILKVTPQIGSHGFITMDIHPSVTEKVGESVSPEGDVAPILDVRETNTVAKARDGQTIIIAGLLQESEETEVTSVPFLEKIPVLGPLFRKTVKEKKKTELVIMFTPTIVVGNEIENQSIEGLPPEWKEVK